VGTVNGMENRISLNTDEMEWLPAADFFPGYAVEGAEPGTGIFVKPLRRPEDGGGCWHLLLRFRPPEGRAIRITAIAQSDEELFMLSGQRAGQYGCNPKGLRHGQTITEDTTVLVHYHDEPDEILRAEVIDLESS
jgi:hypothetical protein